MDHTPTKEELAVRLQLMERSLELAKLQQEQEELYHKLIAQAKEIRDLRRLNEKGLRLLERNQAISEEL